MQGKPEDLRLDAYYYGFAPTGQQSVDLVLSAVACAGKAFHNTSEWNDESEYPPHEGETPVEWIQNAANKAAARLATYEAALRPLASLPIGPEIEDDHDLVIYKNAGRSITVGDILAARKALEDNT